MPTRKKQASARPRGRAGLIAAAAIGAILLIWLLSRIPYNVVYDGDRVYIAPMQTAAFQPSVTATALVTDAETSTPAATLDAQAEAAQAFAASILAAIADRPPDFEDDFSDADGGWTWDDRMASEVEITDGVMRVDGQGGHGIFPPNDQLRSRNFVFEFDVRLLSPGGIGTFFRQQDADVWYSVILDNPPGTWYASESIDPRYLAQGLDMVRPVGETNHILIVALENQFAVYLNSQPAGYFDDATFLEAGNLLPTFHGLSEDAPTLGEFDNFKFWNLDRVPGLTGAPGSVLFEEDFEDGAAETFNYLSQNWQVLADEAGNMVLEGDNTPGHDDGLGAGFGSRDWTDYAVSYRLRILNSNGDAWLNFRNTTSWYVQRFSVRHQHLGLYYAPEGGPWQPIREPAFPAQRNVWYQVRVEAQGETIRIYIDGQLVIEQAGALVIPGDLAIGGLPGSHLQFDDIQVIALDPGATLNPGTAQARAFAGPILAAIEDRPPDFEDDFSNPGSGWQIGTRALQEANQESGEQGYAGGEYFVETAAAHCNSGGSIALPKVRDLVLEVDGRLMAVQDGDWQVHVRNEYAISIELGGMVILGGNEQGEAVSLFKYQGPFIRGGVQADHLQIIARGPQLAVFVNGQLAGYLEDPQRAREGDISFAVCSPGDAPLRAQWDDLKIWDISDLP